MTEAHQHNQKQESSEALVEVVSHLTNNLGETVTPELIADISRIILSREISVYGLPLDKDLDLDLVGIKEASEILNLTRQRVSQLSAECKIPGKLGVTAAGPVWQRRSVENYGESRKSRNSR